MTLIKKSLYSINKIFMYYKIHIHLVSLNPFPRTFALYTNEMYNKNKNIVLYIPFICVSCFMWCVWLWVCCQSCLTFLLSQQTYPGWVNNSVIHFQASFVGLQIQSTNTKRIKIKEKRLPRKKYRMSDNKKNFSNKLTYDTIPSPSRQSIKCRAPAWAPTVFHLQLTGFNTQSQ